MRGRGRVMEMSRVWSGVRDSAKNMGRGGGRGGVRGRMVLGCG